MFSLDCSTFKGPFVSSSFPKSKSADEILPKQDLPSPSSSHTISPRNANLDVNVNVGKEFAGRKILFWAAEPPTKLSLVSQSEAYGDYKNIGTAFVGRNGNVTFSVRQPQVYKVNRRVYPAHIHYSLASSDGKRWLQTVGATFAPRHACNLSRRLQSSLVFVDSLRNLDLGSYSNNTFFGIYGTKTTSIVKDLFREGLYNVFLTK